MAARMAATAVIVTASPAMTSRFSARGHSQNQGDCQRKDPHRS